MTTKVYSVSPKGRVRKPIKTTSTDERIIQLYRELGLNPKDAYREFQWLNCKIQSRNNIQTS